MKHKVYTACNRINLPFTTPDYPFFPGLFAISCSTWSCGIWDKFGSRVWYSFLNQVFPEIFLAISFKIFFNTRRWTCPLGTTKSSWDWGRSTDSAVHRSRIWLYQGCAGQFGVTQTVNNPSSLAFKITLPISEKERKARRSPRFFHFCRKHLLPDYVDLVYKPYKCKVNGKLWSQNIIWGSPISTCYLS